MDGPIDQPQNWRTLVYAFGIWLIHFGAAYSGELIFPNQSAARWVAAGATLIALAALFWLWKRGEDHSTLGLLAIGIATTGVIYDALPPLLVW
ncbi:hypothetical protein [Altericroceibacterium xinjiangense]|uniref:hypothetical protein n=1 Tax=Altericroceibacterium xinjiangense TaxID=762261 RepID=UPI000F7DC4FD|nr:hypothetical protein [Altericroceibacterium xinjiangense]